MSEATSTLSLKIDSSGALSSLNELSDRLKTMRSELAELNKVLNVPKGAGGYSEVSEGMQKAKGVMASYRVAVDGVSHSYKELSTLSKGQVRDIVSTAEAAKREVADRKTGLMQIKAAEIDLARTRASLSQTAKWESLTQKQQLTLALRHARASEAGADASLLPGLAGSQYAASLSAQVGGVNGLNQALATAAVAGRSASSAVDSVVASKGRLRGVSDAATTAVNKHTEAQGKMHAALRGVGAGFDNLWMTYSRYIGYMAGAYATVSGVRKSIESGIEFDYQTRFVATVGDDPNPNAYKGIQQGLLGIKDAPANVNELAGALRVLAQTGVDAATGIETLPTVIAAATLGEVSMKTASEDLIGVLEVFNLRGKDTEEFSKNFSRAGDVMAYVAKSTKANLHDVATTLQGVTGVAEQYGVALETAAAAAAMLGKQGIVASRAGTYQRQMWEEMYIPKSGGAKQAAKELDFTMFDKSGNLKDNLQGLVELVEKLHKYNPESQAKLINEMFSIRGGKQFRAIFNDLEEFKKQLEEAKNSTGLLEKAQSSLAQSTSYQLQQLKADFDNLLTKSWDGNATLAEPIQKLRDVLKDPELVGGLRTIIAGVTDFIALVGGNAGTLLKFGEAMALMWGGSKVIGGLSLIKTGFTGLLPVLVEFGAKAKGLSGVIPNFAAPASGIGALRLALAGIPGAIGAAITAFGGWPMVLLAAGSAMYAFRDKTAEAMESGAASINTFAKNAKKDLAEIVADLRNVSLELSRSRLSGKEKELSVQKGALREQLETAKKKGWFKDLGDAQELVNRHDFDDPMMAQVLAIGGTETDRLRAAKAIIKAQEDILETYKAHGEATIAFDQEKGFRDTYDSLAPKFGNQTWAGPESGKEPKDKGLLSLNPLKEARSGREKDYTSSIKQEKLRLGTELISIETQLAAQEMTSTEATRRKNEATLNSLNIEREKIGLALMESTAAYDRDQIKARQNDLAEIEIAIQKQLEQAKLDNTKAQTALSNALEDSSIATARSIEDMKAEQRELGLTAQEVRKLRQERERERQEQDLFTQLSRGQIEPELFGEKLSSINEMDKAKKEMADHQRTFVSGWDKAYKDYADKATDAATSARNVFNMATSNMEDALVRFATTGKLSFADFTNTVIKSMAQIAAQQATSGLSGLFESAITSLFGSGVQGGGFGGAWLESAPGITLAAKGGVFTSSSLSAFSNQIHDTPQFFAFARGAGVFAEAGPEAIMPLTRTASGDLGVRALGGQGGNMIVNIVNKSEGTQVSQSQRTEGNDKILDVIIEQIKSGIGNDISRGAGPIPGALESTYGLNRVAGAY